MIEYSTLLECMKARRSIRNFTDEPVSREDIMRLIEAAQWAPSNHNRQPWKFLVLENRGRILELAEAVKKAMIEKAVSLPVIATYHLDDLCHYAVIFRNAPVLLVVLHKRPSGMALAWSEGTPIPEMASGEPLSAALAVQNLVLAASVLGLGSCVMTGPLFVPDVITSRVPLPPGYDLNCLIALGHPAETPAAPKRKNLEHIVEFEDQKEN